jgi:hypothetical protein
MVAWVEHQRSFVQGNIMPDMGIARDEARDIATYPDTLR